VASSLILDREVARFDAQLVSVPARRRRASAPARGVVELK